VLKRDAGDAVEGLVHALLVSPDFQGMFFTTRMAAVLREWSGTTDLEALCYTPEEFGRKRAQIGIVREATTKGIRVA